MVGLMLYIAVIWLVAWLITTFIPVPAQGKNAIYIVAGVFTLIILLQAFGAIDASSFRLNQPSTITVK